MSRQFYGVDWRDPAFPTIVVAENLYDPANGLTLTEAKLEVITHFELLRDHARSMIASTRSLRANEVTR